MEQQYLTVKQFAERAGVSTQRIYQLLTKSLQEFTKTENGKKYIDIEGLSVFERETLQTLARDLQSDSQGVAKGLQNPLQEVATSETEILREIVEALRQQLTVKDEQLAAKDKQIEHLTAALLSSQEQHRALTEALTTAQALHAGTIQERLTAQADNSGGQTEIMTTDTVPDPNEGKSVQERQGFFARILGRKSKK